MKTKIEVIKQELEELIEIGYIMLESLKSNIPKMETKGRIYEKQKKDFFSYYQVWYSQSLLVVNQLVPCRYSDFQSFYGKDDRKQIDRLNYTINDAFNGLSFNAYNKEYSYQPSTASNKLLSQIQILEAALKRFDSSLFDIRHIVQADIFASELDSARYLNKNGYHRAAGAVAGVVLERHLYEVCKYHDLNISKKNPSISAFNDILKDNNVIDNKDWRYIQHLGDIRNLCDHNKAKEPTQRDIEDLVEGTDKIIKTII